MVDALELARRVRAGETSSEALINDAFKRIEATNDDLNAVVHTRREKALAEAKAQQDNGQPFLGVPLLLKDLGQNLKGEPATLSSRLFKNEIAGRTDNFVAALQDAGFIVIGQTNAPEYGFKNITDPVLYGKTRNAWDRDRYSGGSSGGAATSVAAGYVPLAAGNDGGGSIRIPASFSGLIGLKPTRGRMPVGPDGWRGWAGASINFALTRSIRDTSTLLDWLQTYQPAAPFSTPVNLQGFTDQLWDQPAHLRIAYTTKSPVGTPVSRAAQQAVLESVDFLKAQGFEVVEQENPLDGTALMRSYYMMNGAETVAMFDGVSKALSRPVEPNDMERLTWLIYPVGLGVTCR
ncbi:MAG TPA: amidase, partial [Lactobacillus sp.]|nr:amidase [Lactobacillus sp.]